MSVKLCKKVIVAGVIGSGGLARGLLLLLGEQRHEAVALVGDDELHFGQAVLTQAGETLPPAGPGTRGLPVPRPPPRAGNLSGPR